MRSTRLASAVLFALASLMLIPVTESKGQAPAPAGSRPPLAIRKIDGNKEPTPVYSTKGPAATARARDWFRVYIEYDTEVEWIDELNMTFYVLVKGRTKDVAPYTLFKGETSYIHIQMGKKHVADMFLHPNLISRYGDVERVAVEVRQGGRVIERAGKPALTAPWWEQLSPVTGALVDRSRSPFSLIDIDAFELIKQP